MQHLVKVKSIKLINKNVLHIFTKKPLNYNFIPGQSTYIAINKDGWQKEIGAFSFINLPSNNYLEFVIKIYPKHKGVTKELLNLKINDELILHDVFGSISYRSEGVFIAGGAGITPFISIFSNLNSKNLIGNNKMIFANKTSDDIIFEKEFKNILGENFINILSDEKTDQYKYGLITEKFLKRYITEFVKNIYLCGPPLMMDSIEKQLANLNIDKKLIIKETFK